MEIISLVGIVVGLIVFILCCVKGVNTLIAGFIGSFVIILTSGGNILEGVTGTYLAGLSGFIKSYFLLFALGALFGKCLAACGGSRRIALAVYHVIEHMGSKNKRFKTALFVPIMYMIMSYVGVSGFVVVYTVLDIAKHVYRKNDVPWRMFTYGGATFLVTMVLPGNLQLNNIAAAGFCGTTVTAAPLLGLCCATALIVIDFLVIFWDAKRSEKNGEGFMDTGAAFVASDPDADSELDTDTSSLPSLVQAVIPLVVMIVLAAVVKLHIVICLAVGIILVLCGDARPYQESYGDHHCWHHQQHRPDYGRSFRQCRRYLPEGSCRLHGHHERLGHSAQRSGRHIDDPRYELLRGLLYRRFESGRRRCVCALYRGRTDACHLPSPDDPVRPDQRAAAVGGNCEYLQHPEGSL